MSWFSGGDAEDWSATGTTDSLNKDLFGDVPSSKIKKKKGKSKQVEGDSSVKSGGSPGQKTPKKVKTPRGKDIHQSAEDSPAGKKKHKKKKNKDDSVIEKDIAGSPSGDGKKKKKKRKLDEEVVTPGGEHEATPGGGKKKRKIDEKPEEQPQARWLVLQKKLEGMDARKAGAELNKKEKRRLLNAMRKTKTRMRMLENKISSDKDDGMKPKNTRNKYKDFPKQENQAKGKLSKAEKNKKNDVENVTDNKEDHATAESVVKKKKKKKNKNKFKDPNDGAVVESKKHEESPEKGTKKIKKQEAVHLKESEPSRKRVLVETAESETPKKKKKKKNKGEKQSPQVNLGGSSVKGETKESKKEKKLKRDLSSPVSAQEQASKTESLSLDSSLKQKQKKKIGDKDQHKVLQKSPEKKKKKSKLQLQQKSQDTSSKETVVKITGKQRQPQQQSQSGKVPFDMGKLKNILSAQKSPKLASEKKIHVETKLSPTKSSSKKAKDDGQSKKKEPSSTSESSDSDDSSDPELLAPNKTGDKKQPKKKVESSESESRDSDDDEEEEEEEVETEPVDRSTALRTKMEGRLAEARFRYLNEQLYTCTGNDAFKIFKSDASAFDVYHQGFQSQVEKWPVNPVDVIISYIKTRPASLVVADFGCGDAKIARSVKNKVHSFDLVAVNKQVTACDMSKVPLAGDSVDIAVFSLSLMGTNLADYLLEANRVMKKGGILKVAEVESRIANLNKFIVQLEEFGFHLLKKDTTNKMFVLLELKKTGKANKQKVPALALQPCLYKKR